MSSNEGIIAGSWWSSLEWDIFSSLVCSVVILLTLLPSAHIIYRKARRYIAFRSAQIQYGCPKHGRYPHKDPLGLDPVSERRGASQAGRGPFRRIVRQTGHTREENLAGQRFNILSPRTSMCLEEQECFIRTTFSVQAYSLQTAHAGSSRGTLDIIKPLFTKAELSDTARLQRHFDRSIAQIPRDGSTVDVQPLLKKMNLDSASEPIFGESTGLVVTRFPFQRRRLYGGFQLRQCWVSETKKSRNPCHKT